jgi:endonuclease/exonuclease/phosphatase (EEP) superfamily protein YafD
MVFSRTRVGAVRRLPTPFGSYRLTVRLPRLSHRAGGRVTLLAVHPRPPIGDVTGWRADQAAVREAARESVGPTVLAGDLNATMDHSSLRELVGRGYADGATQARSGWQPTWPSAGVVRRLGFGVPPLVAIDHVFVRDHLRVARTEVVPVDGTDHRALVATVTR